MEGSSLDSKQLLLIGVLLVAFYFFAAPYLVGHSTDLHSSKATPARTRSTPPKISFPTEDSGAHPRGSSDRTQEKDDDSLSEIEKLLQ